MPAEISRNRADTRVKGARRFAEIRSRARRAMVSVFYRVGLLRCLELLARRFELIRPRGARLVRLRPRGTQKFAVLCYHRVGMEGLPLFSRLQPAKFEVQMRYLRQHYRLVSLGQLCQELGEARLVEPTVAVTFDDGYRDLFTYGFPILQKYGIPATVFLIGDCMETGEPPWYDRIFLAVKHAKGDTLDVQLDQLQRFELGSAETRLQIAWQIICYLRTIPDRSRRAWCVSFEQSHPAPHAEIEARMLNWLQVRTMQKGNVFFGAHTKSHPSVSQLDLCELEKELGCSKRSLEERIGVPILDFAYPFGKPSDISRAAEEFLNRSGYRSAVTTVEGCNVSTTNPFRLRRIQIDDDDSMPSFALRLGRAFLESPDLLEADEETAGWSTQAQMTRGEV